jgi:hypothetical protein
MFRSAYRPRVLRSVEEGVAVAANINEPPVGIAGAAAGGQVIVIGRFSNFSAVRRRPMMRARARLWIGNS